VTESSASAPPERPGSATLFARCLRGLEWVVAAELRGRLGAEVVATGHREVHFRLPGTPTAALGLRTADDVFLHVGSVSGLDHTRASLERLGDAASGLDVRGTAERVRAMRGSAGSPTGEVTASAGSPTGEVTAGTGSPTLEVTASFLGRRNYNRYDIEDAVGRPIARRLGAAYLSRRAGSVEAALSWRVHLAGDRALIGLRLAARPLHRRAYKELSRVGTLHPPLAAALALVTGLRPGQLLLDPFCGAGTMPIEAAALQPALAGVGTDISEPAVRAARGNARAARARLRLLVADAGALPLAGRVVDRVASNPPWQRQVAVEGTAARDERRAWRELARVAAPGARMVVLVDDAGTHERLVHDAGLVARVLGQVSLSGRHPSIVLVQHAQDERTALFDPKGLYGRELAAAFAGTSHESGA